MIKVLRISSNFAMNFKYFLNFCNKIFKFFLILVKLYYLNIAELILLDY